MSSNRSVGLSALKSSSSGRRAAYANHGSTIRSAHGESLRTQLAVFQQLLHQFSVEHGKEIRSDPTFRAEFARMCQAIGVDPTGTISSSVESGNGSHSSSAFFAKMTGFWSGLTTSDRQSDFYYDLAVRVVELCRDSRNENGGLISVSDLRRRIRRGKTIGGGLEVSENDIVQAVTALAPLGPGMTLTTVGTKQLIRSVPRELSSDATSALELIQLVGYATVATIQLNLGWERARANAVVHDLLMDGLVWVDLDEREPEYWSAAFIGDSLATATTRV